MAYRSIEEFEQILRETPPAIRYLDLMWRIAQTYEDWQCIKFRMIGASMAVPFRSEAHHDYRLLADIADRHMLDTTRRIAKPLNLMREVMA